MYLCFISKYSIIFFILFFRDKERKLHTLSNDKELLIKEEVRLQKNISVKQMQLGTLQSEEEQNDKKIETRNYSMNKLSEELKLPSKHIFVFVLLFNPNHINVDLLFLSTYVLSHLEYRYQR